MVSLRNQKLNLASGSCPNWLVRQQLKVVCYWMKYYNGVKPSDDDEVPALVDDNMPKLVFSFGSFLKVQLKCNL